MDQGYMHERGTDRVLKDMGRVKDGRKFEVYECGDPYSRAWDATELPEWDSDIGTYRGDLSGRFNRAGLVRELRRLYPGCQIRNRY
jgi:hypothetical protein